MQNSSTAVGSSLVATQKVKHRITTPRYMSKGMENKKSNKYMYLRVYSSTAYNNQMVETAHYNSKHIVE